MPLEQIDPKNNSSEASDTNSAFSLYYAQAQKFFNQKDYTNALTQVNQALHANQNDAFAYWLRADIYEAIGDLESALLDYTKARDLVVDETVKEDINISCIGLASAIQEIRDDQEADNQEAEEKLQKVCELFANQDYDNALKNVAITLHINPDHAEAYYLKGSCLREMGFYEDALEAYQEAIDLDPTYPWSYYDRALTFSKMNQHQQAFYDVSFFLRLCPGNSSGIELQNKTKKDAESYRQLLQTQAVNKALMTQEEINRQLQQANMDFQVAVAQFHQKDYDNALKKIAEVFTVNEDSAEAHCLKGSCLREKGLYNDALEAYQQAIDLDPKYPWSYYNRALAFTKLNQHQQAYYDASFFLRLCPGNSSGIALQNLTRQDAETYRQLLQTQASLKKQKSDKAIVEAKATLMVNASPSALAELNKELYELLGINLIYKAIDFYEKSDWSNALSAIKEGIRYMPNNAEAFALEAGIYYQLGDIDKELASIIQAAALDPTHYNAKAAAIRMDNQMAHMIEHALKLCEQKNYSAAIAKANEGIRLNANDPKPYLVRGTAHAYTGNLAQALADYKMAGSMMTNAGLANSEAHQCVQTIMTDIQHGIQQKKIEEQAFARQIALIEEERRRRILQWQEECGQQAFQASIDRIMHYNQQLQARWAQPVPSFAHEVQANIQKSGAQCAQQRQMYTQLLQQSQLRTERFHAEMKHREMERQKQMQPSFSYSGSSTLFGKPNSNHSVPSNTHSSISRTAFPPKTHALFHQGRTLHMGKAPPEQKKKEGPLGKIAEHVAKSALKAAVSSGTSSVLGAVGSKCLGAVVGEIVFSSPAY